MSAYKAQMHVPGLARDGMNESIRILQGAISNEQNNRRRRTQDAIAANEKLGEMYDKRTMTDVLKNTDRNVLDENILNQQEEFAGQNAMNKYNSLFDAQGAALTSENAKEQQILTDKQEAYMGDYTPDMSNDQIQAMRMDPSANQGTQILKSFRDSNENAGMVQDTPTEYGDRIYKQLIDRGIDPSTAEEARKREVARVTKAGPSKQALELIKTKLSGNEKAYQAELENMYKANKITKQSGTGAGSSSGSGYSSKKTSTKGGAINAFANDKNINFQEAKDSWFSDGDTPADIQQKLKQIKNETGLPEWAIADAAEATISGAADEIGSSDASIGGKDKIIKIANKLQSGRSSGGGSGKSFSNTQITEYKPGTDRLAQEIRERFNRRADEISAIDDPNARKILATAGDVESYVGDWGFNPKTKAAISNIKSTGKGGKSQWDKDSIIGRAMGSGSKAGDVVRAANENPIKFGEEYAKLSEKKQVLVDRVVQKTADEHGDKTPLLPTQDVTTPEPIQPTGMRGVLNSISDFIENDIGNNFDPTSQLPANSNLADVQQEEAIRQYNEDFNQRNPVLKREKPLSDREQVERLDFLVRNTNEDIGDTNIPDANYQPFNPMGKKQILDPARAEKKLNIVQNPEIDAMINSRGSDMFVATQIVDKFGQYTIEEALAYVQNMRSGGQILQ